MVSIYGLKATDSCLDAASRILRCEYINIVTAADAIYVQDATDPLHDLRVGIRKFRAALRYFSPWLTEPAFAEIDQGFAEIADMLSPARDSDAWLEYLEGSRLSDQLQKNQQFRSYLETLRQQRLQQLTGIRHELDRYFSNDFRDSVVEVLYKQISQCKKEDTSSSYAQFGCRRLGKHYKKLIQANAITVNSSPELIHAFRKKCRRGRYWSEFTIPASQGVAKRLARHFKSLATAIGTARDMQLHILKMQESGIVLPPKFYRWQHDMEKQAWHEIKTSWKKLRAEKLRQQVASKLSIKIELLC